MLAVLDDAIEAANDTSTICGSTVERRQKAQKDARRWIADRHAEWIFSFIAVCEGLHLSPSAARKAIQAGYAK